MADAPLKLQIQEDMKNAMRAKEKARLGTIRMLLSAVKQREIDERISLTDNDILTVINKMIKQRRESIRQFDDAGRTELSDIEHKEIGFLEPYLPEQLDEAKIDAAVQAVISSTGASSMQDIGKVMGALKGQLEGQADMSVVSRKVKEQLQ